MPGIVTIKGPDGPIDIDWGGDKPPTHDDVSHMLDVWKQQRPQPGVGESLGIVGKNAVEGATAPLKDTFKALQPINYGPGPLLTMANHLAEGSPQTHQSVMDLVSGMTPAEGAAKRTTDLGNYINPITGKKALSPEDIKRFIASGELDPSIGAGSDNAQLPIIQPIIEGILASILGPAVEGKQKFDAGDTRGALAQTGKGLGAIIPAASMAAEGTGVEPIRAAVNDNNILPFVSKAAGKVAEGAKAASGKLPEGIAKGLAEKSIDFMPITGVGRAGARVLFEKYVKNKPTSTATTESPTAAPTTSSTSTSNVIPTLEQILSSVEEGYPEAGKVLRDAIGSKTETADAAGAATRKTVSVNTLAKQASEDTVTTPASETNAVKGTEVRTSEDPATKAPADDTASAIPAQPEKPTQIRASELKHGDSVPGYGTVIGVKQPWFGKRLEVEFKQPSGRTHTKFVESDALVDATQYKPTSHQFNPDQIDYELAANGERPRESANESIASTPEPIAAKPEQSQPTSLMDLLAKVKEAEKSKPGGGMAEIEAMLNSSQPGNLESMFRDVTSKERANPTPIEVPSNSGSIESMLRDVTASERANPKPIEIPKGKAKKPRNKGEDKRWPGHSHGNVGSGDVKASESGPKLMDTIQNLSPEAKQAFIDLFSPTPKKKP